MRARPTGLPMIPTPGRGKTALTNRVAAVNDIAAGERLARSTPRKGMSTNIKPKAALK